MTTGLTAETPGVKRGLTGQLIVDRRASDESDEPKDELTRLTPGDTILFRGEEARVKTLGKRSNYGQRGLFSIGFGPEVVGTVATLYVDRDPYLLDICNGPVHEVAPSEVQVPQAEQSENTYRDH